MSLTFETATKFRKRPVVVSAWRIPRVPEEPLFDLVPKWAHDHVQLSDLDPGVLRIDTREGSIYGQPGDWLIQGVKGEVYPCGDEIFRATYEPAE